MSGQHIEIVRDASHAVRCDIQAKQASGLIAYPIVVVDPRAFSIGQGMSPDRPRPAGASRFFYPTD